MSFGTKEESLKHATYFNLLNMHGTLPGTSFRLTSIHDREVRHVWRDNLALHVAEYQPLARSDRRDRGEEDLPYRSPMAFASMAKLLPSSFDISPSLLGT